MTKVYSKLTDTYVKGVLIKKGYNTYSAEEYAKLESSSVYQNYIKLEFVKEVAEVVNLADTVTTSAEDIVAEVEKTVTETKKKTKKKTSKKKTAEE